jgi:hypothetical protein
MRRRPFLVFGLVVAFGIAPFSVAVADCVRASTFTFQEDSRRVRSEGARRETDPAPPWIAFARARSF